ncbi:glycosyltransferase [Agromyces sp. G08B096]|uniref:Glycosyltransferase n=1 Tax=Agromyces sp. G08B096 TaxID=3156399 RepID=A0AAU7W386_9MICO
MFDLDYYRSQSGIDFATRRDAAKHFLEAGDELGISPSPLIQPEWYAHHGGARASGAITELLFGGVPVTTTAPWFDGRLVEGRSVATMRDALDVFLAGADDDTILPTHPLCAGTPTLGAARRAALEASEEVRRREHLNRPRLLDSFESQRVPVAETGPLVSVIMPVRDRADVVGAAVRSVTDQRYRNWELIVVDDGSTDRSADIVAETADGDPRVQIVRGPAAGVCAARNAGLAAASGSFIAFLDSDNRWLPEFLGASVAALMESDAVGVHAVVELVDDAGRRRFLAIEGDREDLLHGGNFVDLNTLVTRRDAVEHIGGFDESLRRWVDYDLAIRLAGLGRLELLPFVGVIYAESSDTGRISRIEAPGWEQRVLAKYLLDSPISSDPVIRDPDLVSIVMLTYADWWGTLRAVRDVLRHTSGASFELLVVDNGSPRNTAEILVAGLTDAPHTTLVPFERNRGFALGNDLAFTRTKGATIVFLNNDASVHAGWLPPLLAALDSGADAAQPVTLNPDGSIQNTGLSLVADEPRPVVSTELVEGVEPIDFASGIAIALRSSAFARVEGFDPLFTNGFDDVDLGLRLRTSGRGKFVVVGDSLVTHHERFTPGRFDADEANLKLLAERRRDAERRAQPSAL